MQASRDELEHEIACAFFFVSLQKVSRKVYLWFLKKCESFCHLLGDSDSQNVQNMGYLKNQAENQTVNLYHSLVKRKTFRTTVAEGQGTFL